MKNHHEFEAGDLVALVKWRTYSNRESGLLSTFPAFQHPKDLGVEYSHSNAVAGILVSKKKQGNFHCWDVLLPAGEIVLAWSCDLRRPDRLYTLPA